MTLPIRDSVDVYLEHYEEAERLLRKAVEPHASGRSRELDPATVALAQVHATLAQAVATTRLADRSGGGRMAYGSE